RARSRHAYRARRPRTLRPRRVRWHGRFALEANALELADSQLALAAHASLPTDAEGAQAVLGRLGRLHRVLISRRPQVRQTLPGYLQRGPRAAHPDWFAEP